MKPLSSLILLLLFTSAYASSYSLSTLKVQSDYGKTPESELGESIHLIGYKELQDSEVSSVEDLLASIPGLNYSGGSNRPKYFQIRGIGERSLYEGVPNHSVGVLIDGIDMSGMGSVGALYGLKQVEVIKSSQATKFGSNALAGVINYTTAIPEDMTKVSGELTYGNYNTSKAGLSYSTPLKALSSKMVVSLYSQKSDGHIDNSYLNRADTEAVEEHTMRLKLQSKLGNKTTSQLSTYFHRQNNGYDSWAHDNSRTTTSDNPGEDDVKVFGSSLKVAHEIDSTSKLVSNTSYALSLEDLSYDEDWGNDKYWNSAAGYNTNYNYFAKNLRKRSNLSEEIRMQGKSYNLGFYGQLFNEDATLKSFKNEEERPSKRIESSFDRRTISLFGDKSIPLSDSAILTIGSRLEHYNSNYSTRMNQLYKTNDHLIGANIKLELFPTEQITRYLTLSRGYKQGGINTEKSLTEDKRFYRPEFMYGLEVGSKRNWSKNLYTTISFFGNLRTDAQVKATAQDDPNDPNSFTYYNGNAAKSYQLGTEGSIKAKISSKMELNASASLLRAKFLDYRYEAINKKGRDLAHAPRAQFNLRTNYQITDALKISAEYSGKDSFYFSDTHDQKSHYYGLLNLSLKAQISHYELSLWSKNLFDKRYATRGFFFANEPPAWNEKLYTQAGSPRTFGVTLRGKF